MCGLASTGDDQRKSSADDETPSIDVLNILLVFLSFLDSKFSLALLKFSLPRLSSTRMSMGIQPRYSMQFILLATRDTGRGTAFNKILPVLNLTGNRVFVGIVFSET